MELSTFYKKTYTDMYKNQPRWKQNAIDEDIKENKSSGLTDDFIRGVIRMAEHEYEQRVLENKLKQTKKQKPFSKTKPQSSKKKLKKSH